MKKFLLLVLCAVAVWAGAATIQWYSDQAATTSLADTDIVALERPVPHGYKSFTLLSLKGYIGTNGVFVANYITVQNITNNNLYSTFINVTSNAYFTLLNVSSNAYFSNNVTVNSNLYATYLTVYSNAYFNTDVTVQSNLYATYLTVNSNLYASYLTVYSNAYFLQNTYLSNAYVTNITANYITTKTLIVESNLTILGGFFYTNWATLATATNTAPTASGTNQWVMTLASDGAVTNTTGPGWVTYTLKSGTTNRYYWIGDTSWVPIGDLTSNLAPSGVLFIPSNKTAKIDIENLAGQTNYSVALQRP